MRIINGSVFDGEGFSEREVAVADGRFAEEAAAGDGEVLDAAGCYVIPGLVDLHFHGSAGADVSDGDLEGLHRMGAYEASRGVTAMCPATMTLPEDVLTRAAQAAAAYEPAADEAALVGINMEGPFISPSKVGAQNPDYVRNPRVEEFRRLQQAAGGLFKIVDIAPEEEGADEFIREHTDLPLFAYDLPVCVHTKLDPTMLVRLGKDGVIQGVKDSSGDDVSFRWLVLENEDAGHPLQLLTGHEVCVDGAYLAGADGSVPGLANLDPASYVEQWRAAQAGDWARVKELQDHLARLMFLTRKVKATVGFGAGVGAFKTALWQMGVFNTNQMREPVCALEGDDVDAIVDVLKSEGMMDADAPVREAHWRACPAFGSAK